MSTRTQQQIVEADMRARYVGADVTVEPCTDDPDWFYVRAVWRTKGLPFISRAITTNATLNPKKAAEMWGRNLINPPTDD